MESQHATVSRRAILRALGAATAGLAVGTVGADEAKGSMAKLFYTEAGQGRHLMLLHGWSCDSHDWNWQLPLFESAYRVVAVDLRGHGRSEVMPSGRYRPADYVRDIESLISTSYPGEQFILVGHSMGGQIAARLAASRPDLVSAVVSVDGSLGFSSELAPLFTDVSDQLEAGDPGAIAPAFFEKFYAAQTDPALKRWHARRLQGTPVHVVRESFRPLFLGDGQVGLGAQSEALCRRVTVPFYHLCRDGQQVERMRPWFSHPTSKVELWTQAGHWLMQDRAAEFNAAVRAWIETLPA